MKLKYYLRGLGLGILVTAVILIVSHHTGNKMSDEDVIKRAKQLGMVMQEDKPLFPEKNTTENVTTEETTTETQTTEVVTTEEPTTEVPTTEVPTTEEPTTEVPTTEAPTEAPTTVAPTEAPTAPGVVTATIEIKRGMYSEAVAQAMQNAGLIKDWNDFNNYLSNYGYAERLQTGSYTMNSSMSYEEMARVLVS